MPNIKDFDPNDFEDVVTEQPKKLNIADFDPDDFEEVSSGQSMLKGGLQGATFGLSDEMAGGLEALGSLVGLRGLGETSKPIYDPNTGSWNLPRGETDEESDQSFLDVYRQARDRARQAQDIAKEANPKTYTASEIAGGVATGLGTAGLIGNADKIAKAKTLFELGKQGAKIGAIEGSVAGGGYSEADLTEGEVGDFAKDVGQGAAIGAGTGLVTPYLGAAAAKTGKAIIKAPGVMRRGFVEGARKADTFEGVRGLEGIERLLKGIKGAVTEGGATRTLAKEYRSAGQEAKKLIIRKLGESTDDIAVIGNSKKIIEEMSDDEAILRALTLEGENPIKQWVADKASQLPGRENMENMVEVLNMGPEARITARAADKKEIAKGLKEPIEDFQAFFQKAGSDRMQDLQEKAMIAFDDTVDTVHPVTGAVTKSTKTREVLNELESALEDFDNIESMPSGVKKAVIDAINQVKDGKGLRRYGLQKGPLETIPNTEKFKRLQRARQTIDSKLKWTGKAMESEAEQELLSLRGKIDNMLKISPEKMQADQFFQKMKNIEDSFFKATEFRGPGGPAIDEFKIKDMLGDTNQAGRFQNAVDDFKNFLKSETGLNEEMRKDGFETIANIEKAVETVKNKMKLDRFNYKEGPTSGAVQRLQSIMNKKGTVLEDIIRGPSTGINRMDQSIKYLEGQLQKPIKEFSESERSGLVRYMIWSKKNETAGPEKTQKKLMELFPTLAKQKAIEDFRNR